MTSLPNQPNPPGAYLRQPTISGETLVFVADDDLWRVGAGGGVAHRLTAGLSEAATPCLSPDGRWLAYAGRDEQHSEVWVMPAAGGPGRRLTWLGSDLAVRGFTAAGRILFTSNCGQPFFRHWHAWTVAVEPKPEHRTAGTDGSDGADGGAPLRLPLGAVDHYAEAPGGRRVIGRNTGDPARWKRYRGGRAGHLWVDDGGGRFRRLAELTGNITCPMWLGERLYFLSDFEGIGNLYSCAADGSGLARHSAHEQHYARHASSDGQRIVYQHAAQLWLLDPREGARAAPRPVPIEVPSARTQAARRFVPAAEHLHGVAAHPQGHSVAAIARGQLFSMPLWEGAVSRHGPAGARQRLATWLADGHTLVAVSDASGEEQLLTYATHDPDPAQREARARPWDIGRVTALVAAPASATAGMPAAPAAPAASAAPAEPASPAHAEHAERVALTNHRNQLLLADLRAGRLVELDRSEFGRIEDPAWSPCGRWLAYTCPTSPRHTAIKLVELTAELTAEGGPARTLLATTPEFRDYAPAFDPEGHYLYFLSLRTFDPVYDSLQFELSFPRGARPYLLALQAHGRPPFDPEPRGLRREDRRGGRAAAAAAHGDTARSGKPLPPVEPEGLARRVAAFPVAEGRFGQIAGIEGGKVVWTQLPLAGAHGRGGHKPGPGRLEVFDFARGRAQVLLPEADGFTLAADGQTLLVRQGAKLRAIDATREPREVQEGAPAHAGGGRSGGGDDKPSRESGLVDLGRLRVAVEPPLEWAQMLREVWRLQRDQFWRADMAGLDWSALFERYAALLPRVATRGELSDLIWELQGELGTSHAYESGGDHRKPPAVALGHLAADLRASERGWEIVRTVQGDPWDAGADSPLNAIGVEARAGERIVAIGGQPVSAASPPQSMLVNQAGAKAAITLACADGATREVLVALLADETPARYREWVEAHRRHVHEASAGRIGYLHLPDMMGAGFAEFHRYFATECDREALIVDVRFNRGGHVSQLLLEKVARRRIAWNVTRWARPQSYPDEAPAGAVVALTNEHSGSDGDIFSHSFKLMGIGPLIGQRTWGGVIGIWPRHKLIDGTETTQPEFSFWFKDVGFGVENFGTEPQVEVDNAPEDDAFCAPARDRQLARAIESATAQIAAGTPLLPPAVPGL